MATTGESGVLSELVTVDNDIFSGNGLEVSLLNSSKVLDAVSVDNNVASGRSRSGKGHGGGGGKGEQSELHGVVVVVMMVMRKKRETEFRVSIFTLW